jgi:hypothetical protein
MEKAPAMVSVPSDRIVSIAHNDSGVAASYFGDAAASFQVIGISRVVVTGFPS